MESRIHHRPSIVIHVMMRVPGCCPVRLSAVEAHATGNRGRPRSGPSGNEAVAARIGRVRARRISAWGAENGGGTQIRTGV